MTFFFKKKRSYQGKVERTKGNKRKDPNFLYVRTHHDKKPKKRSHSALILDKADNKPIFFLAVDYGKK